MKKSKIVIASILKPVDDTRMHEKFGLSMSQTNKYEINIIGFSTKKLPKAKNITHFPLFNFSRLSFPRLLAPVKCFKKFVQLRPDLIIINTHELIIITILYKILYPVKIIYDVQENYFRNILHTQNYPFAVKLVLAVFIRFKEYLSRPFFDHYFLAEKNYENEFSFGKNKSTIIENKYRPPERSATRKTENTGNEIRILFTGTIATTTGIFECIETVKKLHALSDKIRLHIIGHCAIKNVYEEVLKSIKNCDFIRVTGGRSLVPHTGIIAAIKSSDFGFIYYPENESTINSMPTKLWEYLANGLPIILQDHQPWKELCERYQACTVISFKNFDPRDLLREMTNKDYYKILPGSEVLWGSEEKKLLFICAKLLS